MNQRIRELARQAGATVDKGTHPLTGVVDGLFMGPNEVEKFAQSIVQECAKIAEKEQAYNNGHEIHVNINQCILIEFGL